ncbi:MAG: diadenylate cyclase CdaA, partial [Synergistaceae bacterium]|nr:diadenylate cyclase CdaA [Synergistaceae bacterium]
MWLNIRSLIDIAIVSFIIYRILVLLVGTRAIQLVKGVIMLIIFSFLASVLRMRLLSWFLSSALFALSFAIPIVFQPELRKMLEELGKGKIYLLKPKMSEDEAIMKVKQITGALSYLKAHKIGALLVFQQEVGLGEYSQTAIHLNARITQELLISIFWKDNPLHDGAVILDKYNLIAGGCYLPLADAPDISRWYGTRHRAALGISEVSDAMVFIVSEERGDVSLAMKGRLSKNL